jgi:large subunit ribosomal protein L23
MAKNTTTRTGRREKPARRQGGRKDAGVTLLSPRITEKGAVVSAANAYVFNVAVSANKGEIARAVEELFKVKPTHVRVVRTAGKRSWTRGTNRFGRSVETKKAYVYLKKGDAIDFA